MSRSIGATEARVHFGKLLRSIEQTGESVTIERYGQPVAVFMPHTESHSLRTSHEVDWRELVRESQRAFAQARELGDLPDPAELINSEREKRDQQILGNLLGRE